MFSFPQRPGKICWHDLTMYVSVRPLEDHYNGSKYGCAMHFVFISSDAKASMRSESPKVFANLVACGGLGRATT